MKPAMKKSLTNILLSATSTALGVMAGMYLYSNLMPKVTGKLNISSKENPRPVETTQA